MRTIEEAAKEHSLKKNDEKEIAHILSCEDFKAGAKFSQRWIPVEEELPENNVQLLLDNTDKKCLIGRKLGIKKTVAVLVLFKNGEHEVAYRCQCNGDNYMFWSCIEDSGNRIITHWRKIELL